MSESQKSKAPKSISEKELDKMDAQFQAFDSNVKEMTLDRMNQAPKRETETTAKISDREAQAAKDIYLKPRKTISCSPKDKFNERFRKDYEYDKEYVQFIAENKEIIGETIDIWTRPYGGLPAEYWEVPCNKPVWGPRYLAEQIKRKCYHRLIMDKKVSGGDGYGEYFGTMAVDTTIQRLDARPVSTRKSIFMGDKTF